MTILPGTRNRRTPTSARARSVPVADDGRRSQVSVARAMAALVRVGVSAWTEPTLIAAGWYPRAARSDPERRLRYYASRFPLAEIDYTYYALPTRQQGESWARRTPPGFRFDVKAHALFTGHFTDPRRLPKDLHQAMPPELRGRPRLYRHSFPAEIWEEMVRRFRDALVPLRESGRLGAVLLQFPHWFPCSGRNRDELLRTAALLPGVQLAVELRHASWLSARHRVETLAFLRAHGLTFVCVDAPQGFASSMPPLAMATAALAEVRMHGRNAATWRDTRGTAAMRMRYRYSASELQEWVPRIAGLASRAAEVHVVMNNCHADDAVVNAVDIAGLLSAAGLDVLPAAPPPALQATAPGP